LFLRRAETPENPKIKEVVNGGGGELLDIAETYRPKPPKTENKDVYIEHHLLVVHPDPTAMSAYHIKNT
jgi:hypothetical protein